MSMNNTHDLAKTRRLFPWGARVLGHRAVLVTLLSAAIVGCGADEPEDAVITLSGEILVWVLLAAFVLGAISRLKVGGPLDLLESWIIAAAVGFAAAVLAVIVLLLVSSTDLVGLTVL